MRAGVEETINGLPHEEVKALTSAEKYERTRDRQGYRAGHCERDVQTTSGNVERKMPQLKGAAFETAIIERYQRREPSVEEALMGMYPAGVSVRRADDITQALRGAKVSPGTISNPNKKDYSHIEEWRERKLRYEYPYVYLDGICLKRNGGGEYGNVAILAAMAVNGDGCREVIGTTEGMKEDKESRRSFLVSLRERGPRGTRLFAGDCCPGLLEAMGEAFPEAGYQRCVVHFYRNVFSVAPRGEDETAGRRYAQGKTGKRRGKRLLRLP